MALSKICFNGQVLLDLTDTTVSSTILAAGNSVHGPNGNLVIGAMTSDRTAENGIVSRSISGVYENDRVTTVTSRRFEKATSLTSVYMPNVTTVNDNAFGLCTALTTINFPKADTFGANVFRKDSQLVDINLSNLTHVAEGQFYTCNAIQSLVSSTITQIDRNSFRESGVRIVDLPNLTTTGGNAIFTSCGNLSIVNLPKARCGYYSPFKEYCSSMFESCKNLISACLPKATFSYSAKVFKNCHSIPYIVVPDLEQCGSEFASGCSALLGMDLLGCRSGNTAGSVVGITGSNNFQNDTLFDKLIIRYPMSIMPLAGVAAFNNTPFASSGSGGTIYVPQRLLSYYEAASNWSTLIAYENNQILPIEGSYYENHYVDGSETDWWDYIWKPSDGLLSENGWTKVVNGDASETMGTNGCILTSAGDSSGNYVYLRKTDFESDSWFMEVELEFTGLSTATGASNCYLQITDGAGGARLLTNQGKWKVNGTTGTEYVDALPNTTYKIGWGLRGTSHVANIFIDNVRQTGGLSKSSSYKSTLIGSYNQNGYQTIIKSIKMKHLYSC